MQVLFAEALQDGVIGDSLEELAESVFGDAESQAVFQDFSGLLEEDYFEAFADSGDVGGGVVEVLGLFAYYQEVIGGEVGCGGDGLIGDTQGVQQLRCLSFRVEECRLREQPKGCCTWVHDFNWEGVGLGFSRGEVEDGFQVVLTGFGQG